MNNKVRIIKRGAREEPNTDRLEQPSNDPTREITTTIKLWVSEFNQRRSATKASDPRKLAIAKLFIAVNANE